MQNAFGAEGGMFARAGIPIARIETVVDPIVDVLRAARRAGMTVIYLTMQFEPDLSNAGAPDSPNFPKQKVLGIGGVVAAPDGRESRTLVKGTWGTEILPELTPEEGDIETLFGWVCDSRSLLRALEQDHAASAVAGRRVESG